MANENPIKMNDPGYYPEYIIPRKYATKKLFISTITSIDEQGWELDLVHALSLNGDPLDFDPDPDINRKEIDVCENLDNCQLALASLVSRIKNGGVGTPPQVTYKILIEADDNKIDDTEFSIVSDETNPVTFFTKVTFKMEA